MSIRGAFQEAGISAAGLAFIPCGLVGLGPHGARARARPGARARGHARPATRRRDVRGAGRRREVVVGGRRVKTIDVHAHCVVPEALALLGLTLAVDHILKAPGFSNAERRAMLGGTAAKLLGIT